MVEVKVRQAVPLKDVPDVELLAVGSWRAKSGPITVTVGDLDQALDALRCPAVGNPVIKLGHQEPRPDAQRMRWDGEPAVGWVRNLRLSDNRAKLVGDYAGVPGWLVDVMPSAYPKRSVEIDKAYRCQIGHTHPFVITAVSLLGVNPPAVGVIRSLNDVQDLYTVAASVGDPPPQVVESIGLALAGDYPDRVVLSVDGRVVFGAVERAGRASRPLSLRVGDRAVFGTVHQLHLPGRHNQKSHGNRYPPRVGRINLPSGTRKGRTAGKPAGKPAEKPPRPRTPKPITSSNPNRAKAADLVRWKTAAARPGTHIPERRTLRDNVIESNRRQIARHRYERGEAAAAAGREFDAQQAKRKKPLTAPTIARRRAEAIANDPRVKHHDEEIGYYRQQLELWRTRDDPQMDREVQPRRVGTQEPDPKQPLAVYGDMLGIADDSDTTHRHLTELEQVPVHWHATMRDHTADASGKPGGVYVGESAVPRLDDLGHLSGVRPRGWPKGSTWDEVPGAYSPGGRVAALGGGRGTGHGSTSLALHEFGHGADDAIGTALGLPRASGAPEFRALHARLKDSDISVNPYYLQPGDAGPQEAWAEGFAVWAKFRDAAPEKRAFQMRGVLGGDRSLAPDLVAYYDRLGAVLRQRLSEGP